MELITTPSNESKVLQWLGIGLAVMAVAVADVLLKKATVHGDLAQTVRSPWLWGAVVLYLVQIGFFTYAFVAGWKLSVIGSLQTVLYAVIVLAAGVLLYRETVTPVQIIGMLLAVGGVVLINWR
jgi:multidrug transporter EmrE-like cation transporter